MWKVLVLFGVLLGALCAVVMSDHPRPSADVVILNRGDVNTLDVHRMSWLQDFRVAVALCEGLLVSDAFSSDFAVRPGVAERWEVSPDKRTYTFHLRANARWSNGRPVTAEDFRYSWRRAMLPDMIGEYGTLFFLIEGGKEFCRWRQAELERFAREGAGRVRQAEAEELWRATEARFNETVGLLAPDDLTLVVKLVRPTPYFLELAAFEALLPVYGPALERYQTRDGVTGRVLVDSEWTKPPAFVSNGCYMLTEWRFKRDMRLERNPYYWNQAAIGAESILMPSVQDPNAQVLAFQTGAVDWLTDVVPDYRSEMLAAKQQYYAEHKALYDSLVARGLDPVAIDRRMPPDPRQNVHVFPTFGTYFYNFNCAESLPDGRRNPFADPRVRRAFAMAVDKANIVDNLRRSGERVAGALIPPGSIPGYRSPAGLPLDPAAARRLLAEAGYPDPSTFPTVEILFNRDGGHDLIAQAVRHDWEQNLGVSVRLEQKEIKVFREDLKNHNYMVSRAGWFGDYSDPTTFASINHTGDSSNDRLYSSAEYDGLLDQADNQPDPEKRYRILEQAEQLLVEQDVPALPLFHHTSVMMFDPHKISGVSPHPRQKHNVGMIWRIDRPGSLPALEIPPVPLTSGTASVTQPSGDRKSAPH